MLKMHYLPVVGHVRTGSTGHKLLDPYRGMRRHIVIDIVSPWLSMYAFGISQYVLVVSQDVIVSQYVLVSSPYILVLSQLRA